MSRWPNRFDRPSPEPRSRHSSVANIKLASARAGRFAAIALPKTATLMLACIGICACARRCYKIDH